MHTRTPRLRLGIERDREKVADDVRRVIRDCVEARTPWPLLLHGPAGTGKTCAALCLIDATVGPVMFRSAVELVEQIHLATHGDLRVDDCVSSRPPRVYPHEIWRDWTDAALVVLDDIGCTTKASNMRYETIKRALDARSGMPLVVTSNLAPEELEAVYDDRLASRCAGGTVCKVDGTDRRLDRG